MKKKKATELTQARRKTQTTGRGMAAEKERRVERNKDEV